MSTTEYPTPFTQEQNDALYARLVAGDEKARDEMIEGNMALAVFRVENYLRNAPQMAYYREDIIGVAMVGLCEAVDDMQQRGGVKNPKPTGYMTTAIDRRIARLADEANTIVVPQRSQDVAKAEGKIIKPPRLVPEVGAIGMADASVASERDVAELQEEILACCQDETEEKIVVMRAEGNTDAEIAEALNTSRQTVQRRRENIYARFKERCEEYTNEPKDHSYLTRR